MRTKTIQQLCQESINYVVDTLEVERLSIVKKDRDEQKAEPVVMTGVREEIENKVLEIALKLAVEDLRRNALLFTENVESELYTQLSELAPFENNKTKLERELDWDHQISVKWERVNNRTSASEEGE